MSGKGPIGEIEVELPRGRCVVKVWSIAAAEPDVGIMSDYVDDYEVSLDGKDVTCDLTDQENDLIVTAIWEDIYRMEALSKPERDYEDEISDDLDGN